MIKELIGSKIFFGSGYWTILDVQDQKVYILADDIFVPNFAYAKNIECFCWQDSDLRKWLNQSYLLSEFSEIEQKTILRTSIDNPSNLWFKSVDCGARTTDYLFVPSVEEILKYYGKLDSYRSRTNKTDLTISDEDNAQRIMKKNGIACMWWLRTPGYVHHATGVYYDGCVLIKGSKVLRHDHRTGVRVACYLPLDEISKYILPRL